MNIEDSTLWIQFWGYQNLKMQMENQQRIIQQRVERQMQNLWNFVTLWYFMTFLDQKQSVMSVWYKKCAMCFSLCFVIRPSDIPITAPMANPRPASG